MKTPQTSLCPLCNHTAAETIDRSVDILTGMWWLLETIDIELKKNDVLDFVTPGPMPIRFPGIWYQLTIVSWAKIPGSNKAQEQIGCQYWTATLWEKTRRQYRVSWFPEMLQQTMRRSARATISQARSFHMRYLHGSMEPCVIISYFEIFSQLCAPEWEEYAD